MSGEQERLAAPAAAAQEPARQIDIARAKDIARAWFEAHIRNSPVSRDVEAFNHIQTRMDALLAAFEGA